jgi:hypothetical protein
MGFTAVKDARASSSERSARICPMRVAKIVIASSTSDREIDVSTVDIRSV